MRDADNVLSALRPPHLPPAAADTMLGDMALAAAVGLCLALLVALLWPRPVRRRDDRVRAALEALEASRELAPSEAAVLQAQILRSLVGGSKGKASHLEGAALAAHLDRRFNTNFFTKGAGRRLTTSLYEPPGSGAGSDDAIVPVLVKLVGAMRAGSR